MKYFTIALATLMLMAAIAKAADENSQTPAKDAPKAEAKTDEVDISDIQNQYWKAHDKQFEVIQNKTFTKERRFEIGPTFGLYQRVDFLDTKTVGLTAAYHLSDTWGFEVMGHKMFSNKSTVVTKFETTRGATIEYNEEKYYAGGAVLFSPIYGKFSLLGKKISHFDMYLSLGGGLVRTADTHPAINAGIGQKFWITNFMNLRLEYRWTHYTDTVKTSQGITSTQNGGAGSYDEAVNTQNLIFGIGFLF